MRRTPLPIYCAFDEMISAEVISIWHIICVEVSLTLNIRNALLQDLLQDLRILKFLLDLANDCIGEFLLLANLHLSLISNPRVKN
jgi:hypothetical protein